MAKLGIELGLPLLRIGVSDIDLAPGRGKGSTTAGPFLIISRQCGLALDTAYGATNEAPVQMWTTHGKPQQLWSLYPTGHRGEFSLRSEMSGLALDATRNDHGEKLPWLWRHHGEAWQRWRLIPTPDGMGHALQSVHTGRFLCMNEDAQNKWRPWFEEGLDESSPNNQWLLVRPYRSGQ